LTVDFGQSDSTPTNDQDDMYAQAIEFYLSELAQLDAKECNLEDQKRRARLYIDLGDTYYAMGEWDKAIESHTNFLNLDDECKAKEKLREVHQKIGRIYEDRSEWELARGHLEKALKISKELGFEGQAEIFRCLARINWRKGDNPAANRYLEQGVKAAEMEGAAASLSNIYVDMGNIASEEGHTEDAITCYNKGLELLDGEGILFDKSRIFNNLGDLYLKRSDYNKALAYFQKCIDSSKSTKNIRMLGYGLVNAAEVFVRTGRLDDAERSCDEARTIFEKLNEPYILGSVHMLNGMIARHRTKWNESETHFQKSIGIFEGINIPYYLALSHFEFGLMEKDSGDKQKAVEHLTKAQDIWKGFGGSVFSSALEKELADLKR